jgi:hypothetical protein
MLEEFTHEDSKLPISASTREDTEDMLSQLMGEKIPNEEINNVVNMQHTQTIT